MCHFWGLERSGKRIIGNIKKGVERAKSEGKIYENENFLWPNDKRTVAVRYRSDKTLKIDYICDEEIAEVIKTVLINQYATLPDDLIEESLKILGFQRISNGLKIALMA